MKIGDRVLVKDLTRYDDDPGVASGMTEFIGQELTIIGQYRGNKNWYYIEGSQWTWDKRWLEPIIEKAININESEFINVFKGEI